MTHRRVEKCPYCGEKDFVVGIQQRETDIFEPYE